jgi:maltooligosyltrehalose trehalohydrolase
VPFLFFTSFEDPDLVAAVREGRKKELGAHYSESEFADPQAPSTFERSKLDWSKPSISPHAEMLRLHRDLICLRKRQPSLGNCRKDLTDVRLNEGAKWLVVTRTDPSGSDSLLVCNFSVDAQGVPVGGRSIAVTAEPQAWRLALRTGDAAYGRSPESHPPEMLSTGLDSHVSLAGFEAAIYFTRSVEAKR